MGLEHKAFLFDFTTFARELKPDLEKALADGSVSELVAFINKHLGSLSDPYEGERLTASWWSLLEERDPHQYGDFALTKYYDPRQDIGMGAHWDATEEAVLSRVGDAGVVLGKSVGPPSNPFDPGKSGSYFQSEHDVLEHLSWLTNTARQDPEFGVQSQALQDILRAAAQAGRGLYVTF